MFLSFIVFILDVYEGKLKWAVVAGAVFLLNLYWYRQDSKITTIHPF